MELVTCDECQTEKKSESVKEGWKNGETGLLVFQLLMCPIKPHLVCIYC